MVGSVYSGSGLNSMQKLLLNNKGQKSLQSFKHFFIMNFKAFALPLPL
jgi:hypothetical protein